MEKQKSIGVRVLGWFGFLLAIVNFGIYIFILLVMGIGWQIEVFARFIRGNPQALGLIWSNLSPLAFGLLLIYIGKHLSDIARINFIKNVTIAYIVLDMLFILGNPPLLLFSFFNIIYSVVLIIFFNRSVKGQFK